MAQKLYPLHAKFLMHVHHDELKFIFAIGRQVIIIQSSVYHLHRPYEIQEFLSDAFFDSLILIMALNWIDLKTIGDHVALLREWNSKSEELLLILFQLFFAS
jgi:hypothetical protein